MKFFFTVLCLFVPLFFIGQSTVHFQLNWKTAKENSFDNDNNKILFFNNASFNEEQEPVFENHFTDIQVIPTILNSIIEPLTEEETEIASQWNIQNTDFAINTYYGIERLQTTQTIKIIPIRKNALNNSYEKLVEFDLAIQDHKVNQLNDVSKRNKSTISNSVLSTGEWYKISTNKNAVYKITYDKLKSFGIQVETINPRNIHIYGTGSYQLPEPNESFRHEDLVENSIFIHGEEDGVFNESDYILFYGQSADKWTYDNGVFNHSVHQYDTCAYFFLTVDDKIGERIPLIDSIPLIIEDTVTTYTSLHYWEKNNVNHLKSGQKWYGEKFETILQYDSLFPNEGLFIGSKIDYHFSVLAKYTETSASCTFDALINDSVVANIVSFPVSASAHSNFANTSSSSGRVNLTQPNLKFSLKFNPINSNSVGWIDWVTINAIRKLSAPSNSKQLLFQNADVIGQSTNNMYEIPNTDSSYNVWCVTNPLSPKRVKLNMDSTKIKFIMSSNNLERFILFSNVFESPRFVQKLENQNLHHIGSNEEVDYLIISYKDFVPAAQKLAQFHTTYSNLKVKVVEVSSIYNEFSSGAQDVVAIRDFIKHVYENTNGKLKYVLLFGDGSYDHLGRILPNQNFIPTYQSDNSLSPKYSIVTDDFFGYLDNNEGAWGVADKIDIAIGRIIAKTTEEAETIVKKMIDYASPFKINTDRTTASNYDDWQNKIVIISDDEDSNTHLNQAKELADSIKRIQPNFNVEQLFIDAFVQETNAGRSIYPLANQAIFNTLNQGALLLNYSGHGGEGGLADESIINNQTINALTNKYSCPIFITATCSFSRYDNPALTSAGELVLLSKEGAGIALLTTVRIAISNTNFNINKKFINYFLKNIDSTNIRLGDLFRITKSNVGTGIFYRNFTLLGDPAMPISRPNYRVQTTQINHIPTNLALFRDTIKGLQTITVDGIITNQLGEKLNTFNGYITPTVFDQKQTYSTLGNESTSFVTEFENQDKKIFKGKSKVVNGDFQFTFTVPENISYSFGNGKISYYAEDSIQEAIGYYTSFIIGGQDTSIIKDKTPPTVQLYLDSETFAFGDNVSNTPILFVQAFDSTGLLTTATGIGREITLVIDNEYEKVIILNDYFNLSIGSYQNGKLSYPLPELKPGIHNLRFKIWDVAGNYTEYYTEFLIVEALPLEIETVFNYPNPFSNLTQFYFKHNQPLSSFDVQLQILTISGKLVRTIKQTVQAQLTSTEPIVWDGKDDFGQKLANGVYIYIK